MTRQGRHTLVLDAARSIVESGVSLDSLSDDVPMAASDRVYFALDGVLGALYPDEAARISAATTAFDTEFVDLQSALVDSAFSLGVAYGKLLTR